MKIVIDYTYTKKDGSTGYDCRTFKNILDFNTAKKEINSFISRNKKNYIIKITRISALPDNPFLGFLRHNYELALLAEKLEDIYL